MPEAYFRSSSVLVPVSVRTSSAPLSSSTTLSSFPANSQGASKYVAWVDFNQLPLPNKPGANSVDRSSSPLLHLSAALPRASLTGASAAGRLRAAFAARWPPDSPHPRASLASRAAFLWGSVPCRRISSRLCLLLAPLDPPQYRTGAPQK